MSAGSGARYLTVTIHDVAPPTQAACATLIAAILRRAPIPLTLLVVPRYHGHGEDPAFAAWLDRHAARGDELALHGWTHLDAGQSGNGLDRLKRRWYTAGEGEFSALDEAQATRLLHAGRDWFAARGWPLQGFVAPAWLMSRGTLAALGKSDFAYTASLSRLIPLPNGHCVNSLSLVYSTRSIWRRRTSLRWNRLLAAAQRQRTLLRFELHPSDAAHADILAQCLALLGQALAERQALRLHEAAALAGEISRT